MNSSLEFELFEQFHQSNIDSFWRGKYMPVLEAILLEKSIEVDDVLAVSMAWGLLVVHRAGLVFGDLVGVFKKRIEIGSEHAFSEIDRIVTERTQRFEFSIKGYDSNGSELFKAPYGTGGTVSVEDAVEERDRVFNVMASAMNVPAASAPTGSMSSFEFPAGVSSASSAEGKTRKDVLIAWSQQVLREAGVAATQAQITEIASRIAGGILEHDLVPYADDHGVPKWKNYFSAFGVTRETVLDHFNGACGVLASMLSGGDLESLDDPRVQKVDMEINAIIAGVLQSQLAASVAGARQEFGPA